jgi:hypothetical protein
MSEVLNSLIPVAPMRPVVVPWTSSAAGAATVSIAQVNGALQRVYIKPGSGGSQPTDAYDATLVDANGADVLAGQGANLSNTTAKNFCPLIAATDGTTTTGMLWALDESLTLNISNAGNTKSGTVTLYFR